MWRRRRDLNPRIGVLQTPVHVQAVERMVRKTTPANTWSDDHSAVQELRLDGPVVIVQSLTDPGDIGEPRVFEADGVTYVTVPSLDHWRAELFHGHHPACAYTIEGDWSLCRCGAVRAVKDPDLDHLQR